MFKEIGKADELGSRVRKIYKYSKIYFGYEPQMIENDIFKVIIPITPQAKREMLILDFCKVPKSRDEIQALLGLNDREYFRLEILKPLLDNGKLKLTIPDKPNSPHQKYYNVK
jgi:ATP-dependent DNA helicase RecG